jgi:hypothetical protein
VLLSSVLIIFAKYQVNYAIVLSHNIGNYSSTLYLKIEVKADSVVFTHNYSICLCTEGYNFVQYTDAMGPKTGVCTALERIVSKIYV